MNRQPLQIRVEVLPEPRPHKARVVAVAAALGRAARVAVTVPDIGHGTSHHILNEIHAAPSFLWPALVEAAAAEEWLQRIEAEAAP